MFDDDRSTRIFEALRAARCGATRLIPVGEGFAENERWVDRELAAMVEAWHHIEVDASDFRDDDRARCHALLSRDFRVVSVAPERAFHTRWWITSQGREAGTLATARFVGAGALPVFSLYVDPAMRRQGLAADALALAEQSARAVELKGLTVEKPWAWTTALRWLLARGFRVRHWRRSITLQRGAHTPPGEVRFDGDVATYLSRRGSARVALYHARRSGELLEWTRTDACSEALLDPSRIEEALDAEATLALAVALEGFPLVRSEAHWRRSAVERDVGGPESLARQIVQWEAAHRLRGLPLRTPRIPGVT